MIEGNISIIIPMHNEEQNVFPLLNELWAVLDQNFLNFEVIVINDFSTDKTLKKLEEFQSINDIVIITNERLMGQGHSILTGIKNAKYDMVVTIDGDLQVDPHDIVKIYNYKFSNNLDFVASRRKTRHSNGHFTHIPSLLGNILIRTIYMVDLFDVGSSLKILPKSEVIKIPAFKNVHRYISIFLHYKGLSYEEVEVTNRERVAGYSKYNHLKFIMALCEIILLKRKLKIYLKDS